MRLLILSFYYRPDLSAGSFRTTALVDALRAGLPGGAHIDVITTHPNRYGSYLAPAPEHESATGLDVHRISLPAHRSDMLGQSLAYARYALAARRLVAGRHYDLVFATSSRLMTAVLGAWLVRCGTTRLYLDIRDIFVDTIGDILPRPAAALAKPVFSMLERWAVGRANRVNLVSGGFNGYFRQRYPGRYFACFTNGIDDEFIVSNTQAIPPDRRPVEVLYAGNIGDGQGLHAVLPELAGRLRGKARFTVIGDGGRRALLAKRLADAGVMDAVELLPPVSRSGLIDAYRAADVLFLHLNDHRAFEKVLPSKIFEYAALGKPILAGVSGYAAEFLRTEVENAAIFSPCDVAGAERALSGLKIAHTPRPTFVAKYSRAAIARAMADDVLDEARRGASR